MLLEHPEHPGRGVRLAYCMNLHPAGDLDGVLEGMRTITLPLAERLGGRELRDGFGVGMWLPADVALALAVDEGAGELERLRDFLYEHRLDPFTFNAFPYGRFHEPGLKESVFRPTWKSAERLSFTLAVARIAEALRGAGHGHGHGHGHVSISTHTGMYGAWLESEDDRRACAENYALCALDLAQLEEETGLRVVVSLEPEPRSLVNDTRALPGHFEHLFAAGREVLGRGQASVRELAETIVRRHLGTCLDACHAAVEFEAPGDALRNATSAGVPLGKIQFSSALALARPAENEAGRELLFDLAEPVYLHQVTGRAPDGLVRADDLPDLRAAWSGDPPTKSAWAACDEWRCHFHVPVDLAAVGESGLATTRAEADAVLDAALEAPDAWGTDELHLEIETYTWDVLPGAARGPGDLVDGLEREYAHVLARLAAAGWKPAPS